jgi:hypothetical protein
MNDEQIMQAWHKAEEELSREAQSIIDKLEAMTGRLVAGIHDDSPGRNGGRQIKLTFRPLV